VSAAVVNQMVYQLPSPLSVFASADHEFIVGNLPLGFLVIAVTWCGQPPMFIKLVDVMGRFHQRRCCCACVVAGLIDGWPFALLISAGPWALAYGHC